MEEDLYEDYDDLEYDHYEIDDAEDEEDEEEFEASPPDINFEELEDFADDVREIIEYNQKQIDFAKRELNSVEKSAYLNSELIDIKDVITKVKSMLDKRHKVEEELSEMNSGSATAWALEDKQREKEMSLRHRMTLRLAGIDHENLSDFTDDVSHVVDDAYDDNNRQLRKDIKAKLMQLSYSEREEMIERLLEDGRIDQSQYSYLKSEFM
ncbi:MAG: hypothetical protein DRP35_04830 [Candidatus Zixiibacteriota bacterium]|nr:MAG: hypothetical protein DRP35_04830 [candidate division Zixibacteria bacterium]